MGLEIKISSFIQDKGKIAYPNKVDGKYTRVINNEILPFLSGNLRDILKPVIDIYGEEVEEIRIRESQPLMIRTALQDKFINFQGSVVMEAKDAYRVDSDDISKTLQLVSQSSLYALEEELRMGFITLRGGHRIGVTGRVNLQQGKVKTLKYINGFNIRISREVIGVALKVLPYIYDLVNQSIYNTLIISPPRCGKTTLLRDIVRHLSNGINPWGIPGLTIGLVDERSEIAGCYRGVPQKDVGIRTDILDCCPKAEGMAMLIRTMGPEVIATDEIGPKADIEALEEVLNAGVKSLVTVHGRDVEELAKRPNFRYMLEQKIFDRFIILSRNHGVGTVETVLEGNGISKIR